MSVSKPIKVREDGNVYANIDQLRKLQYHARGFSFTPRQPVNSLLSGKHVSKLRGRGLNFEELRHYRPGDDIRCMDWKVTHRTGKPHIKVYTEERERNVYILLDQRSSMFFGSTEKMKSVIAAEIAALVAWRITHMGDRIGALVFSDDAVKVVPAKSGLQHVVVLLSEIVKQNHRLRSGRSDKDPTRSINNMLVKLDNLCRNNSLIIHIGDGAGWNDKSTDLVKKVSQHNEIIAFDVYDPLERYLPTMPQMLVSDGEYQIQFAADEHSMQQKYQEDLQVQLRQYANVARKYRIPLIPINTIEPVEKQVRKAFGQVAP
jgi:uncharacterized protein (DUF58 family)